MNRTVIVIVFLISLLLVGGGGFLVGNALSVPAQDISNVADSILNEAKQRVPEPPLPPKPGGKEIKVSVPIKRTIQVPKTVFDRGPFNIRIPKVIMTTQEITENVEQVQIIDATPEEIANWDAQVKIIREQYDHKLEAEIKKISQEQHLEYIRQAAAIVKDMINNSIIPLLTALAGLIGAIIALRNAFRAPPTPPRM